MRTELAELREALLPEAGEALSAGQPLASFTSFGIGGPADLLLDPPSVEVLCTALREGARLGVPVTCLGGGTNVVIADAGIRGLVVRLGKAFEYLRWQELEGGRVATVEAGAAVRLARLVGEAVDRGYGGLEFAAGIPGSLGGAVLMNAGAFGGEISETLSLLECVTELGVKREIERSDLDFSYRQLALDGTPVVTSVRFRLLRASVGKLREVVVRVQAKRRRGQPVGGRNAGSVFKNPPNEYAGRLIERAGFKGAVVGNARVSPEHANFIVNLGGAKGTEVKDLMGLIQDGVWRKCGVWLEPEIRLIGDWG